MIASYSDDETCRKLAAKAGLLDLFRETNEPQSFQFAEKRLGRKWFFVCRYSNWPDRKDDGWFAHVCDTPETAMLLRAALVGNLVKMDQR